MNVIFFHKRIYCYNKFMDLETFALGGETIAMEEIQPWFLDTISVGDFFEKKVGKAKCSNEDRYDKDVGRGLSKQRMKLKKLTVKDILRLNNKLIVELVDDENCSYKLVRHQGCNSVFFINYE